MAELSNHSTLQVLKRKDGLDGVQTTSIGECLRNVGVEGKAREGTKVSEQGRRRSREMRDKLCSGTFAASPQDVGREGSTLALCNHQQRKLQPSAFFTQMGESLQAGLLGGKAAAAIKLVDEPLDSIASASLPPL